VPARPRERRIAIRILRVNFGAGVQEKLDRILAREGSGAMEGSFFPSAAVAHESSRFDRGIRRVIRIGAAFQ